MTNSPSPLPPSALRQHSDSPILWVLVAVGSLLIHGLVVLGVRLILVQSVRVPVEPEPILVDFDDFELGGGVGQKGRSPHRPTNAPKLDKADPSPPSPTRTAPLTTASAGLPEASLPASDGSPTTKATFSNVSFKNPAAEQPNPKNPKNSSQLPPETAPPAASTDPEPKGPVKSGIQLPAVPSIPNPTDPPPETLTVSNPGVNALPLSAAALPTKFSAQIEVTVPKPFDLANDQTLNPPINIQEKKIKTFSSEDCRLTPDAHRSFGQTVILKLPLDETGQISQQQPILPQQSSGNSTYDDLASCVLKTWKFNPVYDLGDRTILSHKPSSLNVKVVITQ